jgi:hypothetical protein
MSDDFLNLANMTAALSRKAKNGSNELGHTIPAQTGSNLSDSLM